MKKILLANIAIFTGLFLASNAYSANIEDITPANNGSVDITLSDDIKLPVENLESDIKVLKDLIVSIAYKDTSDAKKITINLTYELNKNSTYSLLGVIGSDVNIDFNIGDKIPTEIVLENDKVEKLNIIDEKTIEVFYKEELKGEEFVYKVLKDLGTKEVKLNKGFLNIFVSSPLETFSSYILLVNSFKDADGKEVKFDEVFYEFVTPENLEEVLVSKIEKKEEVVSEETAPKDEGNLEKVAMNSAKVPATGTATGILFLIAGLISGFFFIKSKRK